MSRSGYSDDISDQWEFIMWRGAVASAIRGKRGQQLFRELAEAMDAMPNKRLIKGDLAKDGEHCALGIVGAKRGLALDEIDPYAAEDVSKAFNIAEALAKEIVFMNDESGWGETPERRWTRMRAWVSEQLTKAEAAK